MGGGNIEFNIQRHPLPISRFVDRNTKYLCTPAGLCVRESIYMYPHTHVWELYCEPTNLKDLSLNFLLECGEKKGE